MSNKVEATFHGGDPCTVRAELGDCGAHPSAVPSSEPNPWTDEDVEVVAQAEWKAQRDMGADMVPWGAAQPWDQDANRDIARAGLAALAPRLVERERAAKVEALRWAADSFDGWDQVDAREHCLDLATEIERGER